MKQVLPAMCFNADKFLHQIIFRTLWTFVVGFDVFVVVVLCVEYWITMTSNLGISSISLVIGCGAVETAKKTTKVAQLL